MYENASLMEVLVAERLAEARAAAAHERLLYSPRSSRPSLRVLVGARLIELGERLLGSAGTTSARPAPGC
jgi:hypothetical protein